MDVIEIVVTVDQPTATPTCYGQEVHPDGMAVCASCPVARACYETWAAGLTVVRPDEPPVNGHNGTH